MKIFQIGFNKCGTRYLFKIFTDLGYKGIYNDHGQLARKIFHNFLNCNRLLNEYENYEYYGAMENVYMNLYPHMLFYKQLDDQYPGSKFILNTRDVENWIRRRLEEPALMMDYLWSSGIVCSQVALLKWRELWNRLHKEVVEYFGDRLGKDVIIFNVEKDHPKTLFLFLSDKKIVHQHFLDLYEKFITRFEYISPSKECILNNTDVYCMYLPERKSHIVDTLTTNGFRNCMYYQAVTPNDLDRKDLNILSSTNVFGPSISDCDLCSHNHFHHTIFGKPSKFCVHFSYLACLYHSMVNSENEYTLIFEDDIYFIEAQKEFVLTCDEFMDSRFDVLYLGFGHCKEGDSLTPKPPFRRIIQLPQNQSIICKHAIIYKNNYIKRMFWDLLPLTECSDVQFNHVNILQKAQVCIPTTPFVFQDRRKFGSFNENGEEHEIPLF